MKKNVVFYGNANQGKSTLIGHIISTYHKFDLDKFEKYFKAEFGTAYNPALLYTWIINKDYFESRSVPDDLTGMLKDVIVFRETGSTMTTVTNRNITMEIAGQTEHFTIIDTPGHDEFADERDRGLALGDIGVFCVEIGEVLKDEFNSSHFDKFEIWSKFSGRTPIILLTKTDLNLSEKEYIRAAERVKQLGNYGNDVLIIPVAVIVGKRCSFNVLTRAPETPWYHGDILIEAIQRFSQI